MRGTFCRRRMEEEKGVLSGGEVRLRYWIWEEIGNTVGVL